MKKHRSALSLAAVLLLAFAQPGWAQTARTTLFGTTRAEIAGAQDLGPVPDDTPLEHVLLLMQRSAAAEAAAAAYADALHDPSSPDFHRWLSAVEIGERFGAARSDVDAVSAWLQDEGLVVDRVLPGRMVIDVSGSAANIGRAFGTSIHSFVVDGEPHVANASDISVPAAIAPMLAGPLSLHDFRPHRRHLRAAPRLTNGPGGELVTPGDIATIYDFKPLFANGITGKGQTVTVVEDTDLYSDADWTTFRSVFNLARFTSGSLTIQHPDCRDPGVNKNGDDVEAALDVEWSSAAAPDAAIVLASCHETKTTDGVTLAMTNLINGGSPPKIISVSYGECETLNTPPGNQYYSTLFQQAVMQGVSVFVATGDAGPSDCSSFTNGTRYGIGVSGWASTPYDIAVGGTDFADKYLGESDVYWGKTNGPGGANAKSYIPEQGWNDTCAGTLFTAVEGFATSYGKQGFCNAAAGKPYRELGGGEGGPSSCATGTAPASGVVGGTCKGWPKPRWQSGVIGIPDDGVRDIPDVSLYASDGEVWDRQYAICFSDPNNFGVPCVGTTPAEIDAWAPGGGGTSYAAPIMAGVQALINQRTGSAWGNSNVELYRLAAKEYGPSGNDFCNSTEGAVIDPACMFNDVRLGDDDQDCIKGSADCFAPSGHLGVLSTSTTAYQPSFLVTKGYDFPTGIGTVNATNLVLGWPLPR
jgi:subtilase family serine protease